MCGGRGWGEGGQVQTVLRLAYEHKRGSKMGVLNSHQCITEIFSVHCDQHQSLIPCVN